MNSAKAANIDSMQVAELLDSATTWVAIIWLAHT